MMCAELVEVAWKDKTRRTRRMIANLEDISLLGACLQMDVQVPANTSVRIFHPKAELLGLVRYCIYRDIGYFIGVEFVEGCRWNERTFRPQHLLDPRKLVLRTTQRFEPSGPTLVN
jgi:hypothetical protein